MLDIDMDRKFRFAGIVLRRDRDGYGFVQFESPQERSGECAFFMGEVLLDPEVGKICQVDAGVMGLAAPYRGGLRVIRIDPPGKQ